MTTLSQLYEEREFFIFSLKYCGTDERRDFLTKCIQRNEERITELGGSIDRS